jgi:hypothetical protein
MFSTLYVLRRKRFKQCLKCMEIVTNYKFIYFILEILFRSIPNAQNSEKWIYDLLTVQFLVFSTNFVTSYLTIRKRFCKNPTEKELRDLKVKAEVLN